MVLNLSGYDDDDRKKYIILHEFGHALGLCHQHQHPDYLDAMKFFLEKDSICKKYYGIKTLQNYDDQFGPLSRYKLADGEYDKDSIMHYR